MIDADFFTTVLDENRESVRAAVRDALLDGVKRQFQWEVPEAVRKEVADFIATEVIPDLRAELVKNKAAFIDAATELAKAAPIELAKAMQARMAENLANSWKLKKVVEELVA
ncbi:hypothetical protein [Sphingopyxis sp. JAI128]|uniref:hypothetical protein n=1 Tax=Sphingopyxis sp. JAI128 TaxID=2723066 RepID=UPI001618F3B6|nr:hypothetical protein [Sphingopyxis sp. JAI128]MBB6424981.1 hypothetical protein [Sphingopyxis sp. JAI128]